MRKRSTFGEISLYMLSLMLQRVGNVKQMFLNLVGTWSQLMMPKKMHGYSKCFATFKKRTHENLSGLAWTSLNRKATGFGPVANFFRTRIRILASQIIWATKMWRIITVQMGFRMF